MTLRKEISKQARKEATKAEVAREARRRSGTERDPRHTEKKEPRELKGTDFPIKDGKRRVPADLSLSGEQIDRGTISPQHLTGKLGPDDINLPNDLVRNNELAQVEKRVMEQVFKRLEQMQRRDQRKKRQTRDRDRKKEDRK